MATNLFSGIYYELLRAWPNRWLGYVFSLVLASAIGVVVIALPDRYESSARVYVNSEVVLKPMLRGLTIEGDADAKEKMLKVLQETFLTAGNIDTLVHTPGIGFDASTPKARSQAARTVRSGMVVNKDDDASEDLFTLNYFDSDPVRARNVVQGLLQIFIQTNLGQAQTDIAQARKFLDAQIATYETKLHDAEANISKYSLDNAELLGTTTHQARLTAALALLRDAELGRQVALHTRDRIKAKMEAGKPGSNSTPVLVATDQTFPAVIDRLGALQAQLNQLLLVYTDRHPDVISTRREIALLTQQYGLSDGLAAATKPFTALPGQVPAGIAIDAAAKQAGAQSATAAQAMLPQDPRLLNASAPAEPNAIQMQLMQANFAVLDADRKVTTAKDALRAIDAQSSTAPAVEAALDQMNRDYVVLKENYDQLIRRRESARMTQAADLSSGQEQFRIIQAPTVAGEPSAPDRKLLFLVGAVAAVAAGAALAYALGLLRGTFVTAAEAEQALGLPVIARLTNTHGVLTRLSASADGLVLLGAVGAIFVAAYILSSTTGLVAPLRAEIYRIIDTGTGSIASHLR